MTGASFESEHHLWPLVLSSSLSSISLDSASEDSTATMNAVKV